MVFGNTGEDSRLNEAGRSPISLSGALAGMGDGSFLNGIWGSLLSLEVILD